MKNGVIMGKHINNKVYFKIVNTMINFLQIVGCLLEMLIGEIIIIFKKAAFVIEGDPNQSLRNITGVNFQASPCYPGPQGYLVEAGSDHTERGLVATYLRRSSEGHGRTISPQTPQIPGVPPLELYYGLQTDQFMCKYFTWETRCIHLLIPHLA